MLWQDIETNLSMTLPYNVEIRDDRKHMSMLEDFDDFVEKVQKAQKFLHLTGGQNLGEIVDVQYFQKKLYKSLNVPISRIIRKWFQFR